MSTKLFLLVLMNTTSQTGMSSQLVESMNNFSLTLFHKLSESEENVFFSPFSVSTVLAMLYYGAKNFTKTEMRKVLGYDLLNITDSQVQEGLRNILTTLTNQKDDFVFDIANGALIQNNFTIRQEYKDGVKIYYGALVKNVDFQDEESVLEHLNSWVRMKTRNRIEGILETVDPNTVMMLLNAVYFKGTWRTKFNPEDTKLHHFYNNGQWETVKTVRTMFLLDQKFQFVNIRKKSLKVLELPYLGNISMWILLPRKKDGLATMEKHINAKFLQEIRLSFKNKTISKVSLPKFKMTYSKNLKDGLEALGMESIFHNADLTGISEIGDLYVNDVAHKAVIDVNEEGSEAAAVTSVNIFAKTKQRLLSFIVDHPFLYLIIDNRNDLILFAGRVNRL